MTTPTDITFITNEPGHSLGDRLNTLLSDDTRHFDCLVAYFYISGFYKLYPYFENIDKIRILVGLRTDRATFDLIDEANRESQMSLESHAATAERASEDLIDELEQSPDRADIERGVHKFTEWIRSGKLEIKAHPSENIHAKVYIMTFDERDRDKGRVITGSSNLTQAGLQANLEFNVELKNSYDYDFALTKFNDLWADAVDVSSPFEAAIREKSPYAHFTPYELYLKFLYEYFRTQISQMVDFEDMYVPPGFLKLEYQGEAVQSARKVLDEYGGVFLSDVVGLGKTYMSALLARQLDGRHLVIAPPHLLDRENRGSWPNVFGDFQIRQTDFESIGKLDHLLRRDVTKYTNVFIDESHRFRTETTQSYEALARICRGKRVILVTATPLNNTPRDILSQVKLFQNGKASTIPNLRNLEAFFSELENNLKGLDRRSDREKYFRAVQANARATREKILKYLMIRRTRTEIEMYYGEDMRQQGFKFPEVADPEPLYYKLNAQENEIFDKTILLLVSEFKYARYTPLAYYEGDRTDRELQGQRNLARFMKILMVKRLESSFHAFRLTLARFIHSYEQVIKEYENGSVYISKEHIHKIFQAVDEDNHELIERLLDEDKAERLAAEDFSSEFLRDLETDLATLLQVQDMWAKIKRDPKWEAFREVLETESKLRNTKLIVFSESQETASYLANMIQREVEPKVIFYWGQAGEKAHRDVISNFDANAFQPRDDFRILVSTEVLSEGVNLHRSNVVINYDIPWNPTRLIQRVGRVNRVDTTFDTIHTYTFFPTQESNDLIKLKEAAEAKIHAFIEMLGADARLLTEGEEIKSHDLFARLSSKKSITGEDEDEESELQYLSEIRDVRDTDPDLFTRIKSLPKKARSTRLIETSDEDQGLQSSSLITYFRQGQLDKFLLAQQDIANAEELDFLSAARILRPTEPGEQRQTIGEDFYNLLDRNKQGFSDATSPEKDDAIPKHRGGANDAYILKRLKAKDIRKFQGYTEDDEAYIKLVTQLLTDGALPKPTTKKVATALREEIEPLKVLGILRRDMPPQFLQPARSQLISHSHSLREVILSSYLVGIE